MELFEAINKRYSVKNVKVDALPRDLIDSFGLVLRAVVLPQFRPRQRLTFKAVQLA